MSAHDSNLPERFSNLTVLQTFALGNVCKGVHKVRDAHGRIMVLKSGTDDLPVQEIRMNLVGYKAMNDAGLGSYAPTVFDHSVTDEVPAFILMEYCGDDFLTEVKRSGDPESLYRRLVSELRVLHARSIIICPETRGEYVLRSIAPLIVSVSEQLLTSLGDCGNVPRLLARLNPVLKRDQGKVFCFSNWDFTPEDAYLTPQGLKYSDPHAEIIGVPMVDMGCFAGVARDAHALPGSISGYELLKQAAVETATTLQMSNQDALRYFYLGRVLQSILSASVRVALDKEKACTLFAQGMVYLSKVLD